MSATLKTFYPGLPNVTGSIAYEVELESKRQVYPEADGWVTAGDNSLRYYGIEMKSRAPVKEASISKHLNNLLGAVKDIEWIIPSPRTSVHTHVNVLGLSPIEIFTSVAAYWLFEPVFFALCDSSRKANLFCLRLKDAYGILHMIEEDVASTIQLKTVPFRSFNSPDYRYSSVNLAAVCKFGSLEYRALHGTLDADLLELWGKMCLAVTYRSSRYKSPKELFDAVINDGYEVVKQHVFGKGLVDHIQVPAEEIDEQIAMLYDLVNAVDWDVYSRSLEAVDKSKSSVFKKTRNEVAEELRAARRAAEYLQVDVAAGGGGGRTTLGNAVAGRNADNLFVDDLDN